MAARGGRRPRAQSQRVPSPAEVSALRAAELRNASAPVSAPSPQRCFGRIVSYRINSTGVDEFRPAIILRDDGADLATLFVFTLPGDEIAAGARVAQQRAVSRPKGLEVGQWQLVPAP